MNSDQDLKDRLMRPTPPQDLEQKLRANWQQQLSQQSASRTNSSSTKHWRLVAASVALFVIVAVSFVGINKTPSVIAAALKDISSDKKQNIGLAVPTEKWLAAHQVNMPPSVMPIMMSKYCLIDGNKTLHLQIAGEKQGEVHLFIFPGKFDRAIWQNRKGTTSSMPWQLIQAFNDLSVLVLHSNDMDNKKVQQLIHTMFYA